MEKLQLKKIYTNINQGLSLFYKLILKQGQTLVFKMGYDLVYCKMGYDLKKGDRPRFVNGGTTLFEHCPYLNSRSVPF